MRELEKERQVAEKRRRRRERIILRRKKLEEEEKARESLKLSQENPFRLKMKVKLDDVLLQANSAAGLPSATAATGHPAKNKNRNSRRGGPANLMKAHFCGHCGLSLSSERSLKR